jgi:DNA topoisomerase-1
VPRGDRGKAVLGKLKSAAKDVEAVYLATDPDREGEAIAWHLAEQLKLRAYYRISYTQITAAAVKAALAKPGRLDERLIASQRARQCLDKLVGYEVSPLLWNSTGGKSAGRVQSATLHLICERERERLGFKPEDYWVLKSKYGEGFEALHETEGAKDEEKGRVKSEEEANRIASVARSSPHVVREFETKNETRNPPPPFITSSLQQAAGARYKFAPKHTMKVAQELYEGVNGKGLITYMRTDAVTLSPEFVAEAREWLKENAPEALPEKAPFYKPPADSQGAHEAIRPTEAGLTPEKARAMLSADQHKLYELIWNRAIASQAKAAIVARTRIGIAAADTLWVARGAVVMETGYLRFWKNLDKDLVLPRVEPGQKLDFREVDVAKHATKPPPRYSEPRLVQLMEKVGIGRPSTYASTIATLKDRDYVTLEESMLAPTALGMATDEALTKALPDLVDTKFTAGMEAALDEIAEGKISWEKYLNDWNSSYLVPALGKAKQALVGITRVADAPARARNGAGQAASGKAQEKLTRATAKAEKNATRPVCAKGHGAMVLRLSKKGTYYWKCVFPECGDFAWYQDLSAEKCPVCGLLMEKIPSRKVAGGYFLKCARKSSHPDEVVMFRNKSTKAWERARPRGAPSAPA